MKKYNYLFFDVDDTLLDFSRTGRALERLFAQENIRLTDEIKEHYHRFNKQLWQAYERGELANQSINRTFIYFRKESVK